MLLTWLVNCDNCGDLIDARSEYFYQTMHGDKKDFCAHCWSEHPNVEGVNIAVQQMGS